MSVETISIDNYSKVINSCLRGLTHWTRKTLGEKAEFRIDRELTQMSINLENEQNLYQFLIEIC